MYVVHPTFTGILIRYGNHIEFENSVYDSIKDFNGESLGTLSQYGELSKSLFDKSTIIYKNCFMNYILNY